MTPRANCRRYGAKPGWVMAQRAALMIGAGLMAACASDPPQRLTVPFDLTKARAMLEPGTNQIVGRSLLWLSSGAVISCAGETVALYPVTPYAREWARLTYDTVKPGKATPAGFAYRPRSEGPAPLITDPDFLQTSRSTTCNADGHFGFDNVGDGEFYVVARIAWQPHIWDEHNFFYGNTYYDREGTVMKPVRVRGGVKVMADLLWSAPNSRFNWW